MEMERKKASALVGLLTVLLASFALVPPASAPDGYSENHRYVVMGNNMRTAVHLAGTAPDWWGLPFPLRPPYIAPMLMSQNITFSDPDTTTGVVNLTVPVATYVGLRNEYWDYELHVWFRVRVSLSTDGYGWLFTGTGSDPILGDVDYCTFNNDTGVYWGRKNATFASPFEGQKAADTGALPSPGPDGVAGTADDGFGDGTPDPAGSSILFLNTTLFVEYLEEGGDWKVLLEAPFPQIMTTATAYDIIIESNSVINGANSTVVGDLWEFFAGVDHSEYKVDYGHPKWNAYVTYVSVWSALNVNTTMGDLDLIMQVVEKKVREDCVIGDVDCNELVDIMDILVAGMAFGAVDEGFGPDGEPYTDDDVQVPDPNFDARGDVTEDRGLIDIMDILVMAMDFGAELTPACIVYPW